MKWTLRELSLPIGSTGGMYIRLQSDVERT
jgi:hypothetical protein